MSARNPLENSSIVITPEMRARIQGRRFVEPNPDMPSTEELQAIVSALGLATGKGTGIPMSSQEVASTKQSAQTANVIEPDMIDAPYDPPKDTKKTTNETKKTPVITGDEDLDTLEGIRSALDAVGGPIYQDLMGAQMLDDNRRNRGMVSNTAAGMKAGMKDKDTAALMDAMAKSSSASSKANTAIQVAKIKAAADMATNELTNRIKRLNSIGSTDAKNKATDALITYKRDNTLSNSVNKELAEIQKSKALEFKVIQDRYYGKAEYNAMMQQLEKKYKDLETAARSRTVTMAGQRKQDPVVMSKIAKLNAMLERGNTDVAETAKIIAAINKLKAESGVTDLELKNSGK